MARIALCDASVPLTDPLGKLSSESGNALVLDKFLFRPNFAVWKIIKLGTYRSVASLKAAIVAKGIEVNDCSADIMNKPAFILASQETTVDLVNISVADLGFTEQTNIKDVYARAIELGLSPCPAEVGPQLRLQHADQPKGECLRIMMDAVTGSDGNLHVFRVGHDNSGLWLITDYGDPGSMWGPAFRFIFVLRG